VRRRIRRFSTKAQERDEDVEMGRKKQRVDVLCAADV